MSKRKDDGEKDKQGEIAPSSSLFSALVYLGISVLCALIVFGAFGRAGKAVTDKFFLGIRFRFFFGCHASPPFSANTKYTCFLSALFLSLHLFKGQA